MSTPPAFAALVDTSTRCGVPEVGSLEDAPLLQMQRDLAEIRRRVDAWSAAVAGQIAYRSRRELGYDGLAQRHGARTPELLVQQLAGTTVRESQTTVKVGTLMAEAASDTPLPLDAVGTAVADCLLSLDAADAIRAGLSSVDDAVPIELIVTAAEELLHDATRLTVEKVAARAREWSAQLDEDHVLDREQRLRDSRYLRLSRQRDGMTRLTGLLDPESAAIVTATFDAITSPRRGGPRFVDPAAVDYADRLTRDERETEQIVLDSFVELLRIGSAAAPEIVGAQRPSVRVIVTDHDLARRTGHGQLEGQKVAVSVRTIEREICDRGTVPIHFDTDGQVVNVGREQRLFTRRQKVGLAARDGGCRFPHCERPPSWTETHHINEWHRNDGRTDIADGILLRRYHHLLIHNNGWQVTRTDADYYLVPPASLDPARAPILAPPNSQLVRRALAEVS